MSSTAAERLAANLVAVRERIAVAARAAGREPASVQLVAVTKYVDAATTRLLVDAGCCDLGESRPQLLWEKAEVLRDMPIRWHLIGHLQRNKVRRTIPQVHLLHSGDSLRLLEELNAERAAAVKTEAATASSAKRLRVLLEVNVGGEAAKHGFTPNEVPSLVDRLATFEQLEIRGLMAMARLSDDVDAARRDFAALRLLREQLQGRWYGRFDLSELSMGMSGDFEAAIAEGATLVRIGSALFEGVE